MKKRLSALLLCLLMAAALMTGCSSARTDYKIAMVTDSGAVSDNHLNQAVWQGMQLLEEEYRMDINFYRPQSADTESFMSGIDILVKAGYNIIVLPGPLFRETLEKASAAYPECIFIGIDCEAETVPSNAVTAVFDKSQAGFLAGLASAVDLDGYRFGSVFGKSTPPAQELLSGFFQGIAYAEESFGVSVSVNKEDFVFLDSRTDYPLGQQKAAELFEKGVQCLLVSSDPTGLGAAAESRLRAGAGDDIHLAGSDADFYVTASYDRENELSAAITSALCDYGKAVYEVASSIIEDTEAITGTPVVFDIASEAVGIPENNPNLSEKAVNACKEAEEAILDGSIVIANILTK